MLKRALIVALALMFVLGLSGMALAVSNTSDVDQTGTGNTFDVYQHGAVLSNTSDVDQTGSYNDADVDQYGSGGNINDSTIAQLGWTDWNEALVNQDGDNCNNLSWVYQHGGGDNIATVHQYGNNSKNDSQVEQYGAGGYNIATVKQWGTDNNNTSDVTQDGWKNTGTIDQN